MTAGTASATSDHRANSLAEAFRQALRPGAAALDGPQSAFIAQVLEDYVPKELPELGVADLAANFADLWAFAALREPEEILVRVVAAADQEGRPIARSRLEVVQDDSPFLVDSLMGELSSARLPVRAMFHAVVETRRSRAGVRAADGEQRKESVVQVILDPLDAEEASDLVARVRATLFDVRAAVQDFGAMQALVDRAIDDLEQRRGDLPEGEVDEYQAFL
ncbi:MAG TPA: NAD-glutamate dehydrogenase, partial [Caulobacteraceae bacterium]|nr:NAD-glutamate dehydrogenase [Caulobacteraceae bacterium]